MKDGIWVFIVFVFFFTFFIICYLRCVFHIAGESGCQLLCCAWDPLLLVKLTSLSLIPEDTRGMSEQCRGGEGLSPLHRQMGLSCLLKTNV